MFIRFFSLCPLIIVSWGAFYSIAIAEPLTKNQELTLPHLIPSLAPPSFSKIPQITGNGERGTVNGLEDDLDLSQSHFPLKKEASNQGTREQKNPVACSPFPVPSEATASVKVELEEGLSTTEKSELLLPYCGNNIQPILTESTSEINPQEPEAENPENPKQIEASTDIPAMNMFIGQPTAKHLLQGDVTINFTNRFFSESGSNVDEETAAYPNLGFSWGVTDDLQLTFEGQIVDSGGPGRQGPFLASRKAQANTDFALELKQRLWQYSDQTLSWSGVFSVSAGERGIRFSGNGQTIKGDGGRVTPALQFPFTATLNDWELTISPTVAFFNQANAVHLHRAPIENPGSFGTTFGLVGGVSYNINPRLTIWGDAFVPATGNNSISRNSGRTAKAIVYNGGLRYRINPRVALDVFASNALGTVGPLSLTGDREFTAFGSKLTLMPNWFEGNRRYPDSYAAPFEADSPLTEDGLDFFDGGTVPVNRFVFDLKGGGQGILTALRYGVFKDVELGVFLNYIRGRVDESEQGLSGKIRLLNQDIGDPITASLAISVSMTNEPFINFFTDNRNEFFERNLPKSVPWLGDEDSTETGQLLIGTVSIPLHYQFEQGPALWFTPTIGYVQRSANDIELAGFNIGSSVPIFRDWSLVGEVGANLTEHGNGFRGTFRRNAIPWTFSVRWNWNPLSVLGLARQDDQIKSYVELYVTNRVGFSPWLQMRVRDENNPTVGVGIFISL